MKTLSKNLTINVPIDLVQLAKVVAAKRGTSLNALLTESLEELVRSEDQYMAAGLRFLGSSITYSVDKTWTRDDLHERR